jgi:signal transduction histidine kinase
VVAQPVPETRIACDGARIEMALSNLVDNALKFAPAGSVVTLGADVAESAVRLWVHDTGPGIDPAEAARLFERFYRGDRAVSSGVPGSGLGLSIVRAVARAHGGEARLASSPSGGNLFVIELPLSA